MAVVPVSLYKAWVGAAGTKHKFVIHKNLHGAYTTTKKQKAQPLRLG
jgi:hypothetical protein